MTILSIHITLTEFILCALILFLFFKWFIYEYLRSAFLSFKYDDGTEEEVGPFKNIFEALDYLQKHKEEREGTINPKVVSVDIYFR